MLDQKCWMAVTSSIGYLLLGFYHGTKDSKITWFDSEGGGAGNYLKKVCFFQIYLNIISESAKELFHSTNPLTDCPYKKIELRRTSA